MQELLDRALRLFLVQVLFIVNIHIIGRNIHALPARKGEAPAPVQSLMHGSILVCAVTVCGGFEAVGE